MKTSKGTELPLLNLRGKEYLEVKYRLVWFREDHPDYSIETELVTVTENSALARATIKDTAGRILATSHKFENAQGFPDFIEKAETGSIGRALALIGYGTQFCADELDEGKRLADSPAIQRKPQVNPLKEVKKNDIAAEEDPAEFVPTFGKYKGQKLGNIDMFDLNGYVKFIQDSAERDGKEIKGQVAQFMTAATLYLTMRDVKTKPEFDDSADFDTAYDAARSAR